jgi:hypothetical protein
VYINFSLQGRVAINVTVTLRETKKDRSVLVKKPDGSDIVSNCIQLYPTMLL